VVSPVSVPVDELVDEPVPACEVGAHVVVVDSMVETVGAVVALSTSDVVVDDTTWLPPKVGFGTLVGAMVVVVGSGHSNDRPNPRLDIPS
jgi:hypothetical protein